MRADCVTTRVTRASLLVSFLLLGAAPSTLAASFNIPSGTTTTAQTLNTGETGTVTSPGQLVVSGSRAITLSGGGVVVTNSGTIQSTNSSGRALDTNNLVSGNYNIKLTNSGTVTSTGDAFRINADTGTGHVVVDNSGTIQSTGVGGNNGQALDFNNITSTTGSTTITNQATGIIRSADADAIRPGNESVINNFGSIIAANGTSTSTGNDAIDFQDAGKSGTVNNFGSTSSITGARHGITAKEAIAVYNEGTIMGQAGSGLNIDTATNSPVMLVTNTATGKIIGNAVGGADADGIDIDRLASIDNSGIIQSVGLSSSPNLNEAVAIGGGSITNHVGGMIVSDQRAITVDDSNLGPAFGVVTITNEGTIQGKNGEAISINSTLANSLTNKGTIIGSVTMGAGADTVTLYTGSSTGAIDGGAGVDTLHLAGTGTGTLGAVSNIETLNVDAGHWVVNNAQNYSGGGAIAVGAKLEADHTALTFGGTFIVSGALASDPSILNFGDLSVDMTGSVQAGAGDLYKVGGDFLNHSTQNTQWDTRGAALEFAGVPGTSHRLLLTGTDSGGGFESLNKNFGWGELLIDSSNALMLESGSPTGTAFYVDALIGALFSGDDITNIIGNGFNLYYNADSPDNAYLGGRNYLLAGGGELIAFVPEPGTLVLLLAGFGVIVMVRRRPAYESCRFENASSTASTGSSTQLCRLRKVAAPASAA
jgi:hypothetical protein